MDVINIERTFEQLVPPHNQEGLNILGFFGSMYPAWLGATTCLYVFGEILATDDQQAHAYACQLPSSARKQMEQRNQLWLAPRLPLLWLFVFLYS